jgi:hypothetical protein
MLSAQGDARAEVAGPPGAAVGADPATPAADRRARLHPALAGGSLEMQLLPDHLVDWERLGRLETVLMERVDESGAMRLSDDVTIPLQRVTVHGDIDATRGQTLVRPAEPMPDERARPTT